MSIKYFGDDYLKFHDQLNDIKLEDIIEMEINTNTGFILPSELRYYTNTNDKLIDSLKCIRELKNESDHSKHVEILAKYGLKPVDVNTNTDYLQ